MANKQKLYQIWQQILEIGKDKFYKNISNFELNQLREVLSPYFSQLNNLLEEKIKDWLKEDYKKYQNSEISIKFDLFIIPIQQDGTVIFCYPSIIITPPVLLPTKSQSLFNEGWFQKLFDFKKYENTGGEVVLKNALYELKLNKTFLDFIFKSE